LGPDRGKLGRRVTRQSENFMPLFGGKTSAAAQSENCPANLRVGAFQIDRSTVSPTSDLVPQSERSRKCSCPTLQEGRREPWSQARSQCDPVEVSGAGPSARGGSAEFRPYPVSVSCRRGYLTAGLPWGRTFGTRH
jgi:hypothetical protein